MLQWLNISTAPWYVDLGIWAGVITSLTLIWQRLLKGFFTAIWRAVQAAPQIADGIGRLVEIAGVDIVERLDRSAAQFALFEEREDAQDLQLEAHVDTLNRHEERLQQHAVAIRRLSMTAWTGASNENIPTEGL